MIDQITAGRLAAMQDGDEEFTLVDTRPEDVYEAWHVRGAKNVPFGARDDLDDERAAQVDETTDAGPVITICGKGISSANFGLELDERGYDDVAVVKGGMEDWNGIYDVVDLPTDDPDLELVQIQRRAKGCLGYVVGSRQAGVAAVVDPTRHVNEYKVAAQNAGLEITHVVDTHVHADHISGGRRLADDLGVPYRLGTPAGEREVEYEFDPIDGGETIDVGGIELAAMHAPGHTPETMTYRVGDEALLSSDALFADSIGRTELAFEEDETEKGARMQYETLHEIVELADDLVVCPGHVTVTSDGRFENGTPGDPVAAPLGEVRGRLDVLDLAEDEFVEYVTENVPEEPPNYGTIIAINTGRDAPEDEGEATDLETGPNNCAA